MSSTGERKVYFLLLAALAAVFSLVLVYSDQGLVRLHKLRAEEVKIKRVNQELQEENRRLLDRIERVKSDPSYIEDEARKKLGLIRPDETIYRLREEPDCQDLVPAGPAASGRE
ncbi:MAG: septum formation initiator family protein [Thermodesulfobacteriota bacterium]